MPRSSSWMSLICLISAAAVVGCGDRASKGMALSGRVTYRGELVPLGFISFLPDFTQENRGVNAEIHNGRFSIPAEIGPYPGKFRVSIMTVDRSHAGKSLGAAATLSATIPEKYNNESELYVQLPDRKAYQLIIDLK